MNHDGHSIFGSAIVVGTPGMGVPLGEGCMCFFRVFLFLHSLLCTFLCACVCFACFVCKKTLKKTWHKQPQNVHITIHKKNNKTKKMQNRQKRSTFGSAIVVGTPWEGEAPLGEGSSPLGTEENKLF